MMPLVLDGLRFESGGHSLITGVSARFDSPGISVIMGPNGAGKSLLLRLMHGLLQPSAGQVRWDGEKPKHRIRARQAMLFQRPVLLRRSVIANIEFVLRRRKLQFDSVFCGKLLARVGLDGMQERPARLLSGGEQQRLALARALAQQPEVLFMDEPSASLDPSSTSMIEEITGELAHAGTKVFFVTHDINQARRLADEVIFMHQGSLLEHTPAERFFDNPESEQARHYLAGQIIL